MLDFMQDDADEIVIDTTEFHKGTDASVSIIWHYMCILHQ